MAVHHTSRRVYSAEELRRLRTSQSQPKLGEAIEELDGEDAEIVKDHILRPTKSFTVRSYRSRGDKRSSAALTGENEPRDSSTLQPPTPIAPFETYPSVGGFVPTFDRLIIPSRLTSDPHSFGPSPTSSIKKKKAEAIVRAHGSPTNMRVTAGGRIVPSEQSPLCFPRYGYSAVKVNNGRVMLAPNHNYNKAHQWLIPGGNGFIYQDNAGNFCQMVDGITMQLQPVGGAYELFMPAPNLQFASSASAAGPATQMQLPAGGPQPQQDSASVYPRAKEPSITIQLDGLRAEYRRLEVEHNVLGRNEVIHGRTMSRKVKEDLFQKRRELVEQMDFIRKSIKTLENGPPVNAPTSPRALVNQQSISPARDRPQPAIYQGEPTLPDMNQPMSMYDRYQQQDFFQPCLQNPATRGIAWPPAALGVSNEASLAINPTVAQPYGYDSFDVNQSHPFKMHQPQSRIASANLVSQHDGAHSMTGRIVPTERSRAIPIKAPETKPPGKSDLNPMSPVYKPGMMSGDFETCDSTSASPSQNRVFVANVERRQLQPLSQSQQQAMNIRHDNISPVKKSAHVHSSSVDSFNTADFFPRDTREYSFRQHEYSERCELSGNKENMIPPPRIPQRESSPSSPDHSNSNWNPTIPDKAFHGSPVAPPGTPNSVPDHARKCSVPPKPDGNSSNRLRTNDLDFSNLPDRGFDNESPKNKRAHAPEVADQPELSIGIPSPSPTKSKDHKYIKASHTTKTLDFSRMEPDWLQGYQAGLSKQTVSVESTIAFMLGYCEALKRTKVLAAKADERLAGSIEQGAAEDLSNQAALGGCMDPTKEPSTEACTEAKSNTIIQGAQLDGEMMKRAMMSAENEHALLSPLPDGPHVDDYHPKLGEWARRQNVTSAHKLNPVSQSIAASSQGLDVVTSDDAHEHARSSGLPYTHAASLDAMSMSTSSFPSAGQPDAHDHLSSMTSIESGMYRPWQGPPHRVISPFANALQPVGVNHFRGQAQLDGAPTRHRGPVLNDLSVNHQPQAMVHRSRFHEGSLDGLSSSPRSLRDPSSPLLNTTPTKSSGGIRRSNTEGKAGSKSPSPTKAKLGQLVERIGLRSHKNSAEKAGHSTESLSPVRRSAVASPEPFSPSRRGWRSGWRK